ncbi:hypothetical protein VHP8226_02808 [Vibrio hippocampi]|uniref:MFS transporter n=1 Tax=Vibrio hippocampi TaxID=654686 RepID=A0ABM8ZLK2_9VIBR|nr:hypothetical protein VHP8226_02808 [Vibrio hippocampi]
MPPHNGKSKVQSRTGILASLLAAGFVVSGLFADTLVGLIIGIILIDLGVFSAQVSNQVRVFSIDPQAQSRINGVYMLAYYLGGAFGSFAGIQAFERAGWLGVVGFSVVVVALGFIVNRVSKP